MTIRPHVEAVALAATLALVGCRPADPEATPDAGCTTGFTDRDLDGHGDPALPVTWCGARPADAVVMGDDCDDTSELVFPGHAEVCDDLDNDCDGAAEPGCAAQCAPVVELASQHRYLFCGEPAYADTAGRQCAAEGYRLVAIGTDDEDQFLAAVAADRFGGASFLTGGAYDAAVGVWSWGADGDAFAYTAWATGQPTVHRDGCLAVYAAGLDRGRWASWSCDAMAPYVCERS